MKPTHSVSKYVLGLALCSSVIGACANGSEGGTTGGVDAGGAQPVDSGSGAPASPAGVRIPGLSAPVRAVYDEFGFLHISGKTDEDAFAAVGYFHSANRFFLMDFLRNAIRGTLGKMISAPGIVDRDVTSRLMFATPLGEPLAEKLVSQLDPATKAAADAYTRGVNAWLADMRASRNGASLTAEYAVASKDIRDWEPADSMAVALYQLENLSNDAAADAKLGQVAQIAAGLAMTKPAVAKALQDLYLDFRPTFDAYTVPAANTRSASLDNKSRRGLRNGTNRTLPASRRGPDVQNVLALANERLKTLPGAATKSAGDTGSNNWVITGARTRTGRPLLANDPHLALSNPSIWFPVEIDGKTGGTGTYHAAGGSFPGFPTIQTGHNESIAWGATVAYWDLSDVYVEKLTSGGVEFNGKSVPLVTRSIDFIDQGKTVKKTLTWVPHHGPIVSLDQAAGTAVSIRWRGHDGSTDAQAFLELGRAGSIPEAKAALAKVTSANQNFILADKQGRIGYFPYAKVPIRTWAAPVPGSSSPFFPLPGDGTREWGPPVALADIPQLQDPPAGFIATANADITGAFKSGDPLTPAPGNKPIQETTRADGTRMQRILETIGATGTANTLETMRALQGDTRSLIAATIVPRLVAAAAAAPEGGFALDLQTAAVVTALQSYQKAGAYTCPSGLDGPYPATSPKSAAPNVAVDSIGCTAFHTALYTLFEAAFGDELSDPAVALGSPFDIPDQTVPVLMRSLRNDTYDPRSETFWIDGNVTDHVTTRTEILQRALTKAGAVLATLGAVDNWRWGTVHTVTLRSPLSQPTLRVFDSGPYATPGGLFTVNVGDPTAVNVDTVVQRGPGSVINPLDFSHTSAASIRTLIEIGTDTPHMKIEFPGGADLHRESPFYNNMVPRWVANTPVDFAFGAGAVTSPAVDVQVNP